MCIRDSEDAVTTPDHLLQWINKACVEKKGKLIMPAFSVGRTQEILFSLNQLELENRLPKLDYYLDSPLSLEATELVKSYPFFFNRYIPVSYTHLRAHETPEHLVCRLL